MSLTAILTILGILLVAGLLSYFLPDPTLPPYLHGSGDGSDVTDSSIIIERFLDEMDRRDRKEL